MTESSLVTVVSFCTAHGIEEDFIFKLEEYGLLHLVKMGDQNYLQYDELREIERFLRLHFDLDVNFEGLDCIRHMQDRISDLSDEIRRLRAKLNFFNLD